MYQNLESSWQIVCFSHEPELKNCPICGEQTELAQEVSYYLGYPLQIVRARCSKCDAKGKPYLFRTKTTDGGCLMSNLSDSINSAITSWNTDGAFTQPGKTL